MLPAAKREGSTSDTTEPIETLGHVAPTLPRVARSARQPLEKPRLAPSMHVRPCARQASVQLSPMLLSTQW